MIVTEKAIALGVVLCGGASRRMGRDKARLERNGASLIEHAARVLDELSTEVVLASGASARYSELGLECVLDRVPAAGPLAGLEAALARLVRSGSLDSSALLAVLACDMPNASAGVFHALIRRARARDADVCLLATDAGPEPLFAVYRAGCLAAVRRALDAGERRLIAFHSDVRVETLHLNELAPELAAELPAVNWNRPEDLNRELPS